MASNKSGSSARQARVKLSAQERISKAAYELFSRLGVRAVSIDQVIERSGVAKATLYRYYPTKEHLVLDFLRRREELWTRDWLQREVERLGNSPAERLIAVFDVFDKWFRKPNFDGCSFVNVMLESNPADPVIRPAAIHHLTTIRKFLEQLAREAGIDDPEGFGWKWHMLMKGSIIIADEGDREAACRAREVGQLLLAAEGIDVSEVAASDKAASRPLRRTRSAGRKKSDTGQAHGNAAVG